MQKAGVPDDLTGRLAVITGANSGIGLEACVHLAARGCDVVMCCRTPSKAEAAYEEITKRAAGPKAGKVSMVQLDLADLDNIGTFRTRYDATPGLAGRPIDMLILNAGIMALNERELTKQGIEAQMGTNVIGHFKFTAELIDLCKAATTSRIVSVSSVAHRTASFINFKDFNREKSYSKWGVYGESKLGNIVFTVKLNKLLEEKHVDNVIAVAAHPGYTATNLQEHTIFKYVNYLFAQRADVGAEPTVLAATDPNAKRNGYAGPSGLGETWGHPTWGCKINAAAWNAELQDKLWDKCEELTHANLASKL